MQKWNAWFFYSLVSEILDQMINGFSIKGMVAACIPVFSGRYWFMSAYMLIMFFSKYINLLLEKADKKFITKLLILMILVFNVVPTIIQKDITGNKGKGPLNMLVVYMIGQHIHKYVKGKYKIPYLKIALLSVMSETILNIGLTYALGGTGVKASFVRDYSIFILIGAVCVFITIKKCNFYNKIINSIASHVIAIYLFESALRKLIYYRIFDVEVLESAKYLLLLIVFTVIVISVICIVIDYLRA